MDYTQLKLKAQIEILRDVEREYPSSTIGNAIQQMESVLKELQKKN